MTKAEIRDQIAKRKKMLDFQALGKMSTAAVKNFQTLEIFQKAKRVGTYMPLPDEVDISPLFQALEKVFYIPAFDESSGTYRMARLTTELKKGRFGILEPAIPEFARQDELDLIIVPGIAFDLAGRRTGRGGGFYDRLLPQYCAVKAGLCFDFQTMETVPAEKHDIRMDWLVTETHILKIGMNS